MRPLSMDSSQPPDTGRQPPPGAADERGDLLVRVLVPTAVALILIAAGLAEPGPVQRDLQITAPRAAVPRTSIPVRAHLLDLKERTPAPIAEATVEVVLRGIEGESQEPLARAELAPTERFGFEGTLELPERSGTFQLFATARVPGDDEDELPAEARRRIVLEEAGAEAGRRGRLQTDLQRYELGPLRGPAPPTDLEARVVGGDCTNHAPCELIVWVGSPAASVALVEPVGAREPRCEPGETTGFVRCQLQVRGNEAQVTVVATRGGSEVGRRWVQLPMGSPAPALHRERALVPLGDRPELRVAGLDERYVVDLFHEGRWLRSATVEPSGGRFVLPWRLDSPGLWRVQARRGPFGANTAAVASFWVGDEPGPEALGALARHPRQDDWLDPAAVALRAGELECAPDGAACAPDRVAAFLLAADELEVATYPRSSSGAEQASAGIRTVQWGRRGGAAGLIFLAGILVAVVVYRRARAAGRQAVRILAAAHEDDESSEEFEAKPQPGFPRPRRDLVPAGSAAFLVLIFTVVASIVLARGCLAG